MGQQLSLSNETTFPEAETFLLKFSEILELQFVKQLSIFTLTLKTIN